MIRLKSLREERGFSQKEFAVEMDLPYTTYNSYETGKRAPDYDMLLKFAEYFGVTVDYLLGRTDEPSPAAFSDIPNVRQVQKRKIPVLGEIACGQPIFAD